MQETGTLTVADVQAARERLAGWARHTPVLPSSALSRVAGGPVFLKAEVLQRTGSFKVRGAGNMLTALPRDALRGGVIAASAGNHAQGVAVAAARVGVPCTVVMPVTATLAKVEATRSYGARVIQAGHSYQEAAAQAETLAAERGLLAVPAYDHPLVIAGQGTLGLELVDDLPDAELVVVPVGGGGLAAGIALAVHARRPQARIVGVQASAAPAAAISFRERSRTRVEPAQTIADGIAVSEPGSLTLPILLDHLDDIYTVDEETITQAMVFLLERSKLVTEGAGAAGAALLLSGRIALDGRKAAVVLSGGNVDVNLLDRVVQYGLAHAGRYLIVRIAMDDRPGQLAAVLGIIAAAGANVLDVDHRRTGSQLTFGRVAVELLLETRNAEHAAEVVKALEEAGFPEQPGPPRLARSFAPAD